MDSFNLSTSDCIRLQSLFIMRMLASASAIVFTSPEGEGGRAWPLRSFLSWPSSTLALPPLGYSAVPPVQQMLMHSSSTALAQLARHSAWGRVISPPAPYDH
eukprot:4932710-Amphidinium_carterae.1